MASALTRWDRPAFPALDSRDKSPHPVCWPGVLNCRVPHAVTRLNYCALGG